MRGEEGSESPVLIGTATAPLGPYLPWNDLEDSEPSESDTDSELGQERGSGTQFTVSVVCVLSGLV